MIGQRLATSIAHGKPDLRGCRYVCPRHHAFFVAAVAIGEQQVKASLACIAGDHVNLVVHEHFKLVNFGRAAVWADEVEAGSFRGFVKVHRYLAVTEKALETGSDRRRYSALESCCPECNCITTLPVLFAVVGAPGREGSIKTPSRAAKQHTVTVQCSISAITVVGFIES